MAEFAYNNVAHTATGMSPFFSNYGFNPKASWPTLGQTVNPLSRAYTTHLEEVHSQCQSLLHKLRDAMARYYDLKRKEAPIFKVGDRVLLNAQNIKTQRPAKKLDKKYYGPFLVERQVGTSGLAYRLALPKSWRIHPTFHVSLLEPYREPEKSGRKGITQSEALKRARRTIVEPQVIETSNEYESEVIHDSAFRDSVVQYLIQWKDYPNKRDWTWEPYEHVQTAPNLLEEFHQQFPDKPGDKS